MRSRTTVRVGSVAAALSLTLAACATDDPTVDAPFMEDEATGGTASETDDSPVVDG